MSKHLLPACTLLACVFTNVVVADPSPVARAYLDHALELMAAHSLHRDTRDFDAIRARALAAATHAVTTKDAWPAVREALAALGDRHSALITPARSAGADGPVTAPSGRVLRDGIGYLAVPAHAGGSIDADTAYADALQTLIFRIGETAPCGWVVDLRDNPGGNMWPMLAGLAPLLGDGTVGAFTPPHAAATSWWVDGGSAGSGDRMQAASRYAVELDGPAPVVAVLTGPRTASSGEAVAVAFRGRPATRSFGEATHGVPTGNRGFVLADGAVLFIAASRFTDRNGVIVDGPLAPDQPVPADDALDAAATWLQGQARCRTMRR